MGLSYSNRYSSATSAPSGGQIEISIVGLAPSSIGRSQRSPSTSRSAAKSAQNSHPPPRIRASTSSSPAMSSIDIACPASMTPPVILNVGVTSSATPLSAVSSGVSATTPKGGMSPGGGAEQSNSMEESSVSAWYTASSSWVIKTAAISRSSRWLPLNRSLATVVRAVKTIWRISISLPPPPSEPPSPSDVVEPPEPPERVDWIPPEQPMKIERTATSARYLMVLRWCPFVVHAARPSPDISFRIEERSTCCGSFRDEAQASACAGRVKVKLVPSVTVDSTQTTPPRWRTHWSTMARPRPVLRTFFAERS